MSHPAPGRPAAEQSPSWDLFVDWCTGHDLEFLPAAPATIAAFLDSLPVARSTRFRRVAAIREQHARAGLPDPLPQPQAAPAADPALAHLLAALPVQTWPAGIVGCRDGFLLVLYAGMRLTRNQIRALTPAAITMAPGLAEIDGRQIRRSGTPGQCPLCAITRWLRILTIVEVSGWNVVKREMAGQWPLRAADLDEHDCAEPLGLAWQRTKLLLPPIDRYGWIDRDQPLSVRSISTLAIGRRELADQPVEVVEAEPRISQIPPADPHRAPWTLAATKEALAGLDPLFDQLDLEIDEANRRMRALFGE